MLPQALTLRRAILTIVLGAIAAGALVTQAAAQSNPTVLTVDGPERVEVGEPAVFSVRDFLLGRPIAGAHLFAFPIDPPPAGGSAASALDPALADALGEAVPEDADLTPDSYAGWGGEFLGITDSHGQLRTTFGWPGHRLVVALKRGAIPGYTTIEVVSPTRQALAIRGPELINVGDPARYLVSDRADGSPISGALVFAIPRGNPTPGPEPLPLPPVTADDAVAVDLASLADVTPSNDELSAEALRRWHAIFLGVTDDRGVVEHAYEHPDHYLVVALKREAWPAFMRTQVVPRQLALSGPAHLNVGEPGTYTVADLTRTPIEGAWLYAFPVQRALATSTTDGVEALVPDLETALADAEEITADALSLWGGSFLGRTNERGQLTHAYGQAGDYVVVALKRTFRPGHTRTSVLAQQQLAVSGPGVVNAGDPAEFTVTNRRTSDPVARAAVFAVPHGPFPVPLDADGAPLDAATAAAVDAELASALAEDGESFRGDVASRWGVIFLGWTDARGKVSHSFETPDHYVIVALKREWRPGYTRLSVVPRQLTLDAPASVNAGEGFRVRVGDETGAPVGGSLVFAIPLPLVTDSGSVDSASDAAVAEELGVAADASDDEAIAMASRRRGWLLGRTNDDGLLKAEIERSGQYLLVAVKRSFRHARSRIEVVPTVHQLAIAGPGQVVTGETARFKVSDAATRQPVSRAAVYAIPLPQPTPSPQPVPSHGLSSADVEVAEAVVAGVQPGDEVLSDVVIDRWGARFLGYTDGDGVVAAAFLSEGRFLIVAVKPGYRAGYTHLAVVPPPSVRQLVVEGPGSVVQGEPAKFLVTEARSGEPVARVAMYALPLSTAATPDGSVPPSADELARADALLAEAGAVDQPSDATIARWGLRFLGWTNADGVLVGSFQGTGRYLILGFKTGHVPGYTHLTVLPKSDPRQLAIVGPSSVPQHEPARFRVTELGTRIPVPNTAMWAIHLGPSLASGGSDGVAPSAEALGADLLESLAPSGGATPQADAVMSSYGATFLGFTDRNGELSHRFGQAGRYVVIAFEPSHLPAFALLTVTPAQGDGALQVQGPGVVRVGQPATFFVTTRGGVPVADALLVAWPVDRSIPVPLDTTIDGATLSSALTSSGGRILGRTNQHGMLTAVFEQPNDFVVYALKAGFLPGVTKLSVVGDGSIVPAPQPLPAEIAPTGTVDAQ